MLSVDMSILINSIGNCRNKVVKDLERWSIQKKSACANASSLKMPSAGHGICGGSTSLFLMFLWKNAFSVQTNTIFQEGEASRTNRQTKDCDMTSITCHNPIYLHVYTQLHNMRGLPINHHVEICWGSTASGLLTFRNAESSWFTQSVRTCQNYWFLLRSYWFLFFSIPRVPVWHHWPCVETIPSGYPPPLPLWSYGPSFWAIPQQQKQ